MHPFQGKARCSSVLGLLVALQSITACARDGGDKRASPEAGADAALLAIATDASSQGAAPPPDAGTVALSDAAADAAAMDASAADAARVATLTFHWGPCFGDCPEYSLRLTSAGVVGSGKSARTADLTETSKAFELADQAFAATCKGGGGPTDAQHVDVTYDNGGVIKKRRYVNGSAASCSPQMGELERTVKRLTAAPSKAP